MEQKRPADIFQELLDYLWNGLGLEEKGWKRLKYICRAFLFHSYSPP